MPQIEHLEAIERRLWEAADTLRANSNYASNEYSCRDGVGVPPPRLQPLSRGQGRHRGRSARPRRQEAGAHEGRFLPAKRHLLAARGAIRFSRRLARRRRPGQGHRCGHGVHRGRLRRPARRPAQDRVSGPEQRRARPAAPSPQPGRVEACLRRRLRPHLRILPDQVRRPEGARRRRVLHASLPGLADRPRARPHDRHRPRPGLRLRWHVRAERAHRRRARPAPGQTAHLPRSGEERYDHPPRQDEPRRPRPRRRHQAGHHLLRRPARAARPGRLPDGQPAVQRGRDRRRQDHDRPAPALRPAGRQRKGQGRQRQLRLDQLFLRLPERHGPASSCPPRRPAPAGARPRCAASWSRPATWT